MVPYLSLRGVWKLGVNKNSYFFWGGKIGTFMSEKIVKFHKTMNKSNKIWDFCWKKKENLGLLGGEHCKIPQKDL